MSAQNLVSGTLSTADFDAIMAAFDVILTKLAPFATELSPEERQSLMKQGPKSMEFVTGIHTLATQNPTAIPSTVNMAEFDRDSALCAQLFAINTKSSQVNEVISDTFMATGSDCMVASLLIYRVLLAQRLGALDENLRQLGRRFERANRLPAPPPEPPAPTP